MKKLIYIMLSLCCLVFYSCGMTEPWTQRNSRQGHGRCRMHRLRRLRCGLPERFGHAVYERESFSAKLSAAGCS